MNRLPLRAFVQARMSSRRFPGKVLAPFRGRPLLSHLLERLHTVLPKEAVVLATSREGSDDPLARFAAEAGVPLFRGELSGVARRLREALAVYPCDRFFRVCADSPWVDPNLARAMWEGEPADLVTNVFPRTFPRGRSLELLRSDIFLAQDLSAWDSEALEHVTQFYYRHPERFRIRNIVSPWGDQSALRLVVDRPEDLVRLEGMSEPERYPLPERSAGRSRR